MTLTQISVVQFETNPWTSDDGEPVLYEEYRDLPPEWLTVLDYLLAHPDRTYCWRCDEAVGFVLFEGHGSCVWESTTLAREGDGLVAMLCDDCAPYVPEPSLPTLQSFRFPEPAMAAFFRGVESVQRPGVTGRAWRGEFTEGDLVAANVGAPLRPIDVAGVVVRLEGAFVVFETEIGSIHSVSTASVRHARVVSNDVCQLYGTAPKPALEVVR